jgi:serine/threonine-protein kinase
VASRIDAAPLAAETIDSEFDPFIGTLLDGAYLVTERIGGGGMGCVYRAQQLALGRSVAVKVVHPCLLTDPLTVARFDTEARAASRLNHPNSVGIYALGRAPDGRPYLVMEYLRGQDLRTVLDAEPVQPLPRVCAILLGVLAALVEAHEQEVVHRDLKPENVFLVRRADGSEQVKVVDFGLAQIAGKRVRTQPGTLVGTPGYMSPEQITGEDVDGRSDVFAAGVLLHELLTGWPLFGGDSVAAVLCRVLAKPVPDPRQASVRAIPDALAHIAVRALERAPADRFPSAAAMAAALEEAVTGLEERPSWPDLEATVDEMTDPPTMQERVAALSPEERLCLQAAAVLGGRATHDAIAVVSRGADPRELAAHGLCLWAGASCVELDDEVRRLVLGSIPIEAARAMRERADAWRAQCAAGPRSIPEPPPRGASDDVLPLAMELELARQRLVCCGDDSYVPVYARIAGALADALCLRGQAAQAAGVLREALDIVPPVRHEARELRARLDVARRG